MWRVKYKVLFSPVEESEVVKSASELFVKEVDDSWEGGLCSIGGSNNLEKYGKYINNMKEKSNKK
jgi:hypothetical protein